MAGLLVAAGSLVAVPAAQAAATDITSAGPLTKISISDELNCAVNRIDDVDGEFFGDTACATEIAVGGTLYGPSFIPAGNSPVGFTPISQSPVTGAGTVGDPYKIVTVVDAGTSGLRLTQTDTYVTGQESYRTDVTVANNGTSAASPIVYRGGDCYLQNDDRGFGSVGNPAGAVACVAAADPNDPSAGPGSRIEQWVPLTAGSHYYQADYGSVWAAMDAQTDFPDTCECSTFQDNGAGLSWGLAIPAGQSRTVAHLTNFSPLGNTPLVTTKTADSPTVAAGAQDGYTITVSNPNATIAALASVTDVLPAGFSYVANSTTGATTANPAVSSQTLTWSGPLNVPAASGQTPGSLSLHFNVTASSTPGVYYNNATADGGSFSVLPTGDTAPITVQAGQADHATSTTYGGSTTAQYSDPLPVSALLLDTTADPDLPLSGQSLGFTLGAQNTSGTTNASGVASSSITVNQVPGGYSVVSSFAGSTGFLASSDSDAVTVTKEACTLTLSAPASVTAGNPINLSALLDESDATKGDRSSKTVTFTLVDGAMTSTSVTGTTNAAGSASASATVPAGVYAVTASFAGDTYYTSCASGETLVTVDPAPVGTAKVTGGGFISDGGRTSFGFVAAASGSGYAGQIQVRAPGRHKFHGDTVSSLVVNGTTATWSGTGRWDGSPGYTYTVTAVDNANGSRRTGGPDTISLQVFNGSALVWSASGQLKGGNIVVH